MTLEEQTEIARHFMQPENYGAIEDADCIGIGIEKSTRSYVIMYIKRNDTHILDIKFAANATQDVNTLGSLFTEMVKGDEISKALQTTLKLEQDLQQAYADLPKPQVDLTKPEGEQVKHISTEYQDCANMVLTSFRAAMRHFERKLGGVEEDYFEMNIAKSCPYSGTDCHFMQTEADAK